MNMNVKSCLVTPSRIGVIALRGLVDRTQWTVLCKFESWELMNDNVMLMDMQS